MEGIQAFCFLVGRILDNSDVHVYDMNILTNRMMSIYKYMDMNMYIIRENERYMFIYMYA
jgi:hypothetical protein